MSFDNEKSSRVTAIETMIKNYIPKEEGYQKTVFEAMNYSLMAGGKRLRPMLMEETFLLFDGKDRDFLDPFMAAIEMIHTYSLVHDDLPAMDNDEYRRGRKTTHVVYGEAMAILAGDGLLNYAFETAAKAFDAISDTDSENEQLIQYKRVAKAMKILSQKAGIYGMIGGQVVDVEEYDGIIDRDRLDFIYQLKTAALVEASMMIGAVLAGATETEVGQIEKIAGGIGLAFQIKDDILDVTSTEEVLGKPIHSDEKNQKTTYVSIMGINEAEKEVVKISEEAVRIYDALPYQNEYLRALILQLIYREK
ncbi:polyprenyl synthetase family protein [Mobilitalea sibirica]|uniref:Farnesyl diphosphate synthase n=1 Tax=Mobilitalea sibirica TaxID=1462919 RepID=A0A8J7L2A7_9FIRM|nr:farnesyl diphosphate synthase [Mobilitalea sibirica]MBH1940208.1 polyprenyl synthetase family protein [Mobilitalea sibirica]